MKSTIDPVADEPCADAALAVPVWDVPIRLFHWLLVALIAFSWWSAENDRIEWHIWSGIGVLTLLVFRILWGFFGSSTARFRSFVRGPRAVAAYLRDPGGWRGIGHNPLGALSVVILLLAVAVQVGLGLISLDEDGIIGGPLVSLVSFDLSEQAREWHQLFFNILLILIFLHVAAIAYYRVFRRKRLVGPMLTGRAIVDGGAEPMRAAKPWTALVCLIASLAFARWIVAGAPPFGG